ncbi:hypothetical protein B296_00010583 [Ensete ventricosum]|uniref:SMP-LTD domain-containing protein n=1 Tax=Ensete ventricosum TaxID=4639 RepID=A0A427A2Z5_ENSVE|nr:hypothetical protein B296_00010583 [Ensete ventricosum]
MFSNFRYQIGLRYTGGARMLLSLSLKFGIVPIVVPVGIRDFDIDGELWVKLRLIPTEPWIGAVSWAFVSLPKIKFELSPFRLFNLMGLFSFSSIPVLSLFLTKLLTEDLPRLFVRPKKIVLDFQKGKALGPIPYDFKTEDIQEGNKDFVGELSVELGLLQDTVPTDKIVALQGGWSSFGKQLSGELLLRLTYKAYVEDEDGTGKELVDSDAFDDESTEYEQADESYEQSFSDYSIGGERESFMDVLAALLVSEEFLGIVSSETGSSKVSEQSAYPESSVSKTFGRDAEISIVDDDSPSGGSRGTPASFPDCSWFHRFSLNQLEVLLFADSTLVWLAIITSIAVLIATNVGSSGFFNP